MARIAGVDLPRNKKIVFALPYIYGIGINLSKNILNKMGIDINTRVHELAEEDVLSIRNEISNSYQVEGDLRSDIGRNIKRLMDVGSYRGLRHRKKLPTRGQRTHTNARTRRGKKGLAIKRKVSS